MSKLYDDGMLAETIFYQGANDEWIPAYYARPQGAGPFPSVVVLHHMPGWDEWSKEVARKFAHHGYAAILPNLHYHQAPGLGPDEASAAVREAGGQIDDYVVGDVAGAAEFLRAQPYTNKKVGVIGFCSGGRAAYLVAGRLSNLDAAVDCWGGGVVLKETEQLTPSQPVAPIDLTRELCCPLLGIFGNEDVRPSPAEVDRTEEELKKWNKEYEFHRYDGAGHGFFAVDRPNYRQAQAVDGWQKVFAFYDKHLRVPEAEPSLAGVR